ncbi:MAG: 1-deoxy-D-xylulose-5-phosphate synthase N-terminal domain-containing protein [Thermoproteota archaeon]|nr:transketolase [Candidatus Brockarchaeota archaeon]
MSIADLNRLKIAAEQARKNVIAMSLLYNSDIHLGSSLSVIEILAVVILKFKRDEPYEDKDWLILSKGHAAPALYAILAEKGVISIDELWKIQDISSILQGHPEVFIPGVDMSTGSLGQGLSFGVGIAKGIKMSQGDGRVYVIMGDGEQDEGQVWEAATHAVSMELNNLISIIDVNGYQLDGTTEEIKPKHYLPKVWEDIGWNVLYCDGHDISSISYAISSSINSRKPTIIFAKTVRGKGLPSIENTKKQRVISNDAEE